MSGHITNKYAHSALQLKVTIDDINFENCLVQHFFKNPYQNPFKSSPIFVHMYLLMPEFTVEPRSYDRRFNDIPDLTINDSCPGKRYIPKDKTCPSRGCAVFARCLSLFYGM